MVTSRAGCGCVGWCNMDILREHVADESVDLLLNGAEAQYPRVAPPATFRRAPRRRRQGQQNSLV